MLLQLVQDIEIFVGLSIGQIIILLLISLLINLLLDTFFLKLALEFVKQPKNSGYKEVFNTAFICLIFIWLPIIGIVLSILAIYSRHDTKIATAIGVWILTILLPLIFTFILLYLFALIII